MLSRATERMEVSAQNMANMVTPGYKAHRQFSTLVDNAASNSNIAQADDVGIDFSAGKLNLTGNPLDLAISGRGFFAVRNENGVLYTRDGQFSRDGEGKLINADGLAVQSLSGDVVIGGTKVEVLADGTVMSDGEAVAQLKIADFENLQTLKPVGAGLFAAPAESAQDVASPQIRQGMLETSNVSTAEEMLGVMSALRNAESGQRVAQVYDDLLGRALTAFGQGQ